MKKRVLITPMDWGLGHASRCVKIIRKLNEYGYEVIIGCDNKPLHFLKKEFPNHDFVRLKAMPILYSKYIGASFAIFLQIHKLVYNYIYERYITEKIINQFKIDAIITDNRFGVRSKKIPSIFVTHQVEIRSKYFMSLINYINTKLINKFNECWIVDDKKNRLSGSLSNSSKLYIKTQHLSNLSRFRYFKTITKKQLLVLVSGPEPQRSIFEKKLIEAAKKLKIKSIILQCKPSLSLVNKQGNTSTISHLQTEALNKLILESKYVISRSGYTTVMDLAKLKKKSCLIATKAQYEQEYLSSYISQNGFCLTSKLEEIDLEKIIGKLDEIHGFANYKQDVVNWKDIFKILAHA